MPPATTSQSALQNLQTAGASAKTPDQVYQDTSSSLGVPAAQQQVSGLRGAINNTTQLLSQVAPSVMGRTANSLVTSAQANRQISNEQAPLNDQLNKENTDYAGASSDLGNLMDQVNTRTGNTITGQQNQLSYLQGIYSDLSASEQQKIANDQAQQQITDARNNAAASRAASAGGISLAGGSGGGVQGSVTRDPSGGYAFKTATGVPITMGQYLDANGGGYQQALQMLQAGSANDKQIATQIQALVSKGATPQQLAAKYPQVFGG